MPHSEESTQRPRSPGISTRLAPCVAVVLATSSCDELPPRSDETTRTTPFDPPAGEDDRKQTEPVPNSIAAASEDPNNGEVLDSPPPRVEFEWTNVELGVAKATRLGSGVLSGTVTNLTEDVLGIELLARADAGTNQTIHLEPWTLEVLPGDSERVDLPLSAFGFDLERQKYSGRVTVKLRIFDQTESDDHGTSYAPDIYFHHEGDHLVVYDTDLMRRVYKNGDFRGISGVPTIHGVVTDRIVEGTRVTYSSKPRTAADVISEGDDAGVPEE